MSTTIEAAWYWITGTTSYLRSYVSNISLININREIVSEKGADPKIHLGELFWKYLQYTNRNISISLSSLFLFGLF